MSENTDSSGELSNTCSCLSRNEPNKWCTKLIDGPENVVSDKVSISLNSNKSSTEVILETVIQAWKEEKSKDESPTRDITLSHFNRRKVSYSSGFLSRDLTPTGFRFLQQNNRNVEETDLITDRMSSTNYLQPTL